MRPGDPMLVKIVTKWNCLTPTQRAEMVRIAELSNAADEEREPVGFRAGTVKKLK